MEMPSKDDIMAILSGVIDPELGSNIVELGMVKGIEIDGSEVTIKISLTTSGCPLRAQIQNDTKSRVKALSGVESVKITWGELTAEEKSKTMAVARKKVAEAATATRISQHTRVLAIASGKGGVGKSSVTTNLAVSLTQQGFNVGVIDADILGFSLPRLLGVETKLEAKENHADPKKPLIVPHRIDYGTSRIELVSMGLLIEKEQDALLWRGLLLNRAVQHFLEDVDWGQDLDYIVVDLPPGTGDVAMGLARMLPRTEMLIVTTPAIAAQKVAARAVDMARKNYLRVAGVIENMSYFVDSAGVTHNIFGSGGGKALADEAGVPLLGKVPIEASVAEGGDNGSPVVLGNSPAGKALNDIANELTTNISPPIQMEGCSARIMNLVEQALAESD